jgi:hypothetical protein
MDTSKKKMDMYTNSENEEMMLYLAEVKLLLVQAVIKLALYGVGYCGCLAVCELKLCFFHNWALYGHEWAV